MTIGTYKLETPNLTGFSVFLKSDCPFCNTRSHNLHVGYMRYTLYNITHK